MSYFSTAIASCLEDSGMTQLELAQRAGVVPANLSRYVKGRVTPGPDLLEKVCAAVASEYRFRLIAAYVLDHLPTALAKQIIILSTKPKSGKTGTLGGAETKDRLPAKAEEALAIIRKECKHNSALVSLLVSTARLLKER